MITPSKAVANAAGDLGPDLRVVPPILIGGHRPNSTTMIEKDRRASQRFKAKPGSIVCFIEGAGAIRDLSMDGIFILDAEPLEVGTLVTFSVRLGNETAAFQGIVRRSVPQEGMGIQFKEVSRETRRRLLSHVARLP